MISLHPANRSTCAEYLASYRKIAFPDIFYDFLHPFISSLNTSSSPSFIAPPATPPLASRVPGISTPAETAKSIAPKVNVTMRNDADERIETIWTEWEVIAGFLEGGVGRTEDRPPETSKAGVS